MHQVNPRWMKYSNYSNQLSGALRRFSNVVDILLETMRDQAQSPWYPAICVADIWITVVDSHYLAPTTQVLRQEIK